MNARQRRARRKRARNRSLRVEAIVGGSCAALLVALATAQYASTGKVSDAIVTGLVTICLTAIGRLADMRLAQEAEDEEEDKERDQERD